MAKWGEGDSRWLVEERPEAENVNNWHWTEKNVSHWSKEKLNEILIGTNIETDFALCTITEISKCDGDAVVNSREAKLIVFYEWAIDMKWEGALINSDTTVTGRMEITHLCEEHEMKDVDVNVHLETSGPEAEIVKDMMISTGGDVIRRQLSQYVTMLKEEFSKGLALPTQDDFQSEELKCDNIARKEKSVDAPFEDTTPMQEFEVGEINTTQSFKCTAEEFYRAMTVKELVQAFCQGNCVLEAREGGNFEVFDGNIEGSFVKLVPNQTIQQKLRLKTWPVGHYSDVTIEIDQKQDSTEVKVTQLGVPKTEMENIFLGWKRFYWDSMSSTLRFF